MEQRSQQRTSIDFSGGLVTYQNLFAIPPNATTNCMDVKFGVGGSVQKRLGSTTLNATAIVSAVATGFTPDSGGTLSTNPNAFWKMNEQAGTRTAILSSLDLTANNGVGFSAGILANAGSYAAANSMYLSRANNSSLVAGTGSFSFTSWINLTTKAQDQVFISKYSATNTANREYRTGYDVLNDRFYFDVRSSNTEARIYANQLGSPSTSTWYLLTAIHNSATSISSIRVNTLAANSSSTFSALVTGVAPFLVGVARSSNGFQLDSGGNLLQNLTANWRMEEASGSRADATGRGNTLTANGTGTLTVGVGRVDSAAVLVPSSAQYFTAVNNSDVSPGNASFTLQAWLFLVSTGGANKGVFYKDDGATNREYALICGANGAFNFKTRGGDGGIVGEVDSLVAASANAWTHVVAWQDVGANTVNLQVNNGTVYSATRTGTNAASTFNLQVGGNTVNNAFLDGRLDECAIWNRALTAGERADLYYGGSGNRYSTDYATALVDEVGVWGKALSNQEVLDLWNGGAANTYDAGVTNAGWAAFDFGAGFSGGNPLRWIVVAAGTGIYASSNRGVTFVTIATDRGANYQFFERSKNLLIATSESGNKVLYWAGSVNTFMAALAVGSAPPAKHALDFGGFLLLMNNSAGARLINYADNTKLTTDAWASQFEIGAALDDEITDGIFYNQAAYVYTKYTVSRLTTVGGNPDFAVRQVRSWGAIPGTVKKVTLQGLGEVMICLSWDRRVRIYDGVEDRIISTPIEQMNGISPVGLSDIPNDSLSKCRAEVDTNEQVYRLWFTAGGSTLTSHCFCLDLRTMAWYPYQNQPFNAAVMSDSGNSRILAGVSRNGFVHWLNTSNTDAGTAINEFFDSPLLFSTPRTVTKNKKLTLYLAPTSSGTLYYQDRSDFNVAFNPVRHRIAMTDTTSVVQVQSTVDVPLTQNVYQFRLMSSASTANPWTLTRLDAEFQDLGMGKA